METVTSLGRNYSSESQIFFSTPSLVPWWVLIYYWLIAAVNYSHTPTLKHTFWWKPKNRGAAIAILSCSPPHDLLWTWSLLRGKAVAIRQMMAGAVTSCMLNASLSLSQISLLTRPCRWKARDGSTTTWAPTRSGTTWWDLGLGALARAPPAWSAWKWSSGQGARTGFCSTSKKAATSLPWR